MKELGFFTVMLVFCACLSIYLFNKQRFISHYSEDLDLKSRITMLADAVCGTHWFTGSHFPSL